MSRVDDSIKYLIQKGLLVPMSGIELYHGRAGDGSGWAVDAKFNNAGDATRYKNVNSVSALNTSRDISIAAAFAGRRAEREGGKAEVHQIVSSDPRALILDSTFDIRQFDEKDQQMIAQAVRDMTTMGVNVGAPVLFQDRDKYIAAYEAVKSYRAKNKITGLLGSDAIDDIAAKLGHGSSGAVANIVSALNSKIILSNPNGAIDMVWRYAVGKGDGNKYEDAPISREYLASWMSSNHIVGTIIGADSYTLQVKISNYILFDLNKVNTERAIGDRYASVINTYGDLAEWLDGKLGDKKYVNATMTDAKTLVEYIREDRGQRKIVDKDAGVWEEYTVGEHTECALRVFDDSFVDDVPSGMLPFIRTAILLHDYGKGVAVEHGNKSKHTLYTKVECEKFYKKHKIDPKVARLLSWVIDDSQRYTTSYYVHGNAAADYMLQQEAGKVLQEVVGEGITDDMVRGLAESCKILQTCDSGAYTSYAVTRDHEDDVYYHSAGTFNGSVAKSEVNDLRGRRVRLKEPENPEK